ncbi:hypothetical protein [Paraburkholderia sp. HP33-1]|uniref:hypothetical protein n=1 Tax=Paraburkholderia sp. HP33-1 TaxID=2883243 RepID=UPI001F355B11|nr:hypothetical protein [Paraburkholderia sp. HP33-1]
MSNSPPSRTVALQPAPLETLAILTALDGRAQIAVANDLEAICAWLARLANKPATFDSDGREAERLLLWSLVQFGKALSPDCPRITRYLEPALWQEVKDHIPSMPQKTQRDHADFYRVRWLLTLLYLGRLRVGEVGGNIMGQFFVRRYADSTMRWWLTVHGEDDRERLVPATRELTTELSRDRQSLGTTALPSPSEAMPLVLPIGNTTEPQRKKTEGLSLRPLTRAIVTELSAGAASPLRERGEACAASADLFEQASEHWLRHCARSRMADRQVDIGPVRDNLGHASLTTSLHLHVDGDRRHSETDEKHCIDGRDP